MLHPRVNCLEASWHLPNGDGICSLVLSCHLDTCSPASLIPLQNHIAKAIHCHPSVNPPFSSKWSIHCLSLLSTPFKSSLDLSSLLLHSTSYVFRCFQVFHPHVSLFWGRRPHKQPLFVCSSDFSLKLLCCDTYTNSHAHQYHSSYSPCL